MKLEDLLKERSGNACELCGATNDVKVYEVAFAPGNAEESSIYICPKCQTQVDKKDVLDNKHWELLSTSMWSEVPAIQVVSWRMLNRLRNESWAADNLDMMYLADDLLSWAKASGDHESDGSVELHRDVNGALLQDGDTVVLTKSLDVKGSSLNAKMGTVVKNIRVVADNIEQIEGKIEGQLIVILTKYVRKQNA